MLTDDALMALLALCAETPDLACFANPREADGNCGLAVDIFLDIVQDVLPEVETEEVHFTATSRWYEERSAMKVACISAFSYRHARHHWYLSGCRWPGHIVARVGDWLIDWTARQFNPVAPFPLVFRMPDVCTVVRRDVPKPPPREART